MVAAAFVLLAAGVAGAVGRPFRVPSWVVPAGAALVALAAGVIGPGAAGDALHPLVPPLAFLLAAVPLAVLLDEMDFFRSIATLVAGGRRQAGALWVVAALTTTVLNLDAAVVLLTPLYLRVADRSGVDRRALAYQPMVLALLASSALPVSNLTNLIAASRLGLGSADFLARLAIPSLVACVVGWFTYRAVLRPTAPMRAVSGTVDRRALTVGGAVVVFVLAGFVGGDPLGIAPWEVALTADVILVLLTRRVPLRAVPWGTALVAASLAVLAAAAAGHLPLARWVSGTGLLATLRAGGVAAAAANVMDNLPALLLTVGGGHPGTCASTWGLLVGVNMGPSLLLTGTLAALLWHDAVGRMGLRLRASDFSSVMARICVPAFLAALVVLIGLQAAAGCR